MSIASEITRINNNIAATYTALSAKGATMPATENSANLASTVATVPSGGDPANKAFDVTNGVLDKPTVAFNANSFAGVTSVAQKGLDCRFQGNTNATGSVLFQNVTSIGRQSFHATFDETSISSISFPLLTSIPDKSGVGYGAMYYMCNKCTYLESVNFPELVTVGESGLSDAFRYCGDPTNHVISSVNFDKLTTVGKSGMSEAFRYSRFKNNISFTKLETLDFYALSRAFADTIKQDGGNLNTVYFPSLTTVSAQSFASCFGNCPWLTTISFPSLTTFSYQNAFANAFSSCTNLTEIHFRQDAQTSVEALDGYSSKWGASNATIYFDL